MTLNDLVVLIILLSMAIISAMIGYEFYRSTDRDKMRGLWIELFWSKTYLYIAYSAYYIVAIFGYMAGISLAWVFIIVNLPTFIAKLRLWAFIRKTK